MRFLRTFRRDDADLQAFAAAAEPGEWAVSGAFVRVLENIAFS